MDWMLVYIVAVYAFVLVAASIGALNAAFDAGIMQRVALLLFALWAAWRVYLIFEHGWSYPHEPLIATALLLYGVGTIAKTVHYRRHP